MVLRPKNHRSGSAKAEGGGVPCLYSNNSNEHALEVPFVPPVGVWTDPKADTLNEFSTTHKKSSYALQVNVASFIQKFGLNNIGFLTLTFSDQVHCPKEAQRRFNSLRTGYLKQHFVAYIRVYERHKSGAVHIHLLVVCKTDIRRGFDFAAVKRRNYRSANSNLKTLWANMRKVMPRYSFGRHELMPIRSSGEAVSRYLSKYIGKHIESRIAADKGVRLVQTSMDKKSVWKIANCNFAFNSPGSKQWRQKLEFWVINTINPYFQFNNQILVKQVPVLHEGNYPEVLAREVSPKWAYLNRKNILGISSKWIIQN